MKRAFFLVAISLLMFAEMRLNAQSPEFRTGRSLEVEFNVLQELARMYVDTVDMDKLIRVGIDAMLESLDPYTVLIPEEESETVEMMKTGSYGGIGALIRKTEEGVMIVEPYEGSPAAKAGLVAGDVILKIGDISTLSITVDECSAKMKGVPGTSVSLIIKKLRGGETVSVNVIREKVHIPDVAYHGIIADSIGYVRITGFTIGGAEDLRRVFTDMRDKHDLKRLVLDFRGNGGGILDEAVEIVSLFVPKGTKVVSAKGRIPYADMDYYTTREPVDTDIPIFVLVNSASASSSELVAGALQDLDRATILGTRTFGKGLVQAIRDVGYNNSLKITISKYYTPSGRCVQAIDYSQRNEDGSVGNTPDSLVNAFRTSGGRTVYDGGGITPDIEVQIAPYSRLALSLVYGDVLYDYSVEYFKEHLSIPSPTEFSLSEQEYEDFIKWAAEKSFDFRTASEAEFDRLVSVVKRESLFDNLKDEIEVIEKKIKPDKETLLRMNKEELKQLIEEEICNRYYFQRGRIESMVRKDPQLSRAMSAEPVV